MCVFHYTILLIGLKTNNSSGGERIHGNITSCYFILYGKGGRKKIDFLADMSAKL